MFAKLASRTLWIVLQLAAVGVQSSGALGMSEDPLLHEKLDTSKSKVSKLEMPFQEFLLTVGEVGIVIINRCESGIESRVPMMKVGRTKGSVDREIGIRIDGHVHCSFGVSFCQCQFGGS